VCTQSTDHGQRQWSRLGVRIGPLNSTAISIERARAWLLVAPFLKVDAVSRPAGGHPTPRAAGPACRPPAFGRLESSPQLWGRPCSASEGPSAHTPRRGPLAPDPESVGPQDQGSSQPQPQPQGPQPQPEPARCRQWQPSAGQLPPQAAVAREPGLKLVGSRFPTPELIGSCSIRS
jgi:hypothetical protein